MHVVACALGHLLTIHAFTYDERFDVPVICSNLARPPPPVLTTEFMLLVPRRAEGDGPVRCLLCGADSAIVQLHAACTLHGGNGVPLSPRLPSTLCSCNAVAFAGSIFVKSLEEQRYVEQRKPLHILSAVGFEW